MDSLATLRMLPLLLGFRLPLLVGGWANDWVLFFGRIWFRSASALFSEDTDIVPVELSILLRLLPEP